MGHHGAHSGRHYGWHYGGLVSPPVPVPTETFILRMEVGARVTYKWQSDARMAWSGREQRSSMLAKPRQRYEARCQLSDAEQRAVLRYLATEGPAAAPFGLGLAFEAAVLTSPSDAAIAPPGTTTIALWETDYDWLTPGQAVIVLHPDGVTSATAVIQSVNGAPGDTCAVAPAIGSVAVPGALIMPLASVMLDAQQTIARYPVNLSEWSLTAFALAFRYGTAGEVGVGASVATYDGVPLWDRGVGVEGSAAQALITGAQIVDRGGASTMLRAYDQAQWLRPIAFARSLRAEWQWLKKFLDTVNGMRVAFLVPTGRPDLAPVGDASSGTLTVVGDYASTWWPSLAHRRLQITLADRSVHRRTVTAASGSDLTLDSALAGEIRRVEFLETVRLNSDEVSVEFTGAGFRTQLVARVVQA